MKRNFESVSSIGTFTQCGQKYAFKYRDRLPDPSGPEAELGDVCHKAAYAAWHTRVPTHSDPRVQTVLAALFADPFVQKLPRVQLEQGKTCEVKVQSVVGGVQMVAYIDILLPGLPPIDLKFQTKRIDARKLSQIRQHLHYPLALGCNQFAYVLTTVPKQRDSMTLEPIPMSVQLRHKPEVQIKKLFVTDEMKADWEKEVRRSAHRISLDVFYPRPSRLCDWCPYKTICPAFRQAEPLS